MLFIFDHILLPKNQLINYQIYRGKFPLLIFTRVKIYKIEYTFHMC